jgi:DNA-binding PadR family transcriptional regulator
MPADRKILNREILLSFWKVHILHHAAKGPIVGQWMIEELREHGYDVSPGTLYPMLNRMERNGWLKCTRPRPRSAKSGNKFVITAKGRQMLARIHEQMREMRWEVLEAKH